MIHPFPLCLCLSVSVSVSPSPLIARRRYAPSLPLSLDLSPLTPATYLGNRLRSAYPHSQMRPIPPPQSTFPRS
ncbi:hypothetical protein IE53DRAFT_386898 [Violaceomyces palustris]|uniref:Uncharacterized protein n=1 Tax=Violaceomyces palustris TaxID=1673888 RepID=A0ACD0NYG0_9BASI|nr:hypothetical protein IE53DRAFT_386898 [Violaceomyces palustris]